MLFKREVDKKMKLNELIIEGLHRVRRAPKVEHQKGDRVEYFREVGGTTYEGKIVDILSRSDPAVAGTVLERLPLNLSLYKLYTK